MNPNYPNLLSPIQVGNVILKNRMINPPAHPYHGQAGETWPSDSLIECYASRARGGAAIVTCDGNSFGKLWEGGIGWDASNPDSQNYMAQMSDAVHFYGARAHGSIMVFPPRQMSIEEIPVEKLLEIVETYSTLAKHMADCGFDGIYIHMAYRMVLTGQMLSPLSNQRTDEFGGSLENRMRFPLLLCKRIKEKCGKNFLIEACITGQEEEEGGWTLDDTVAFAKAAEGLIDILTIRSYELDNQHPTAFAKSRTPFLYMAEYIKRAGVKQAIAASAGFFDPKDCEQAIAEGKADLISMARAFISNPDYGRMLYEGREEDIVPCLRCNKCHAGNKNLTVCVVNPRFGSEKNWDRHIVPVERKKRVAIIGGGPAGMQAALTLASRGHSVSLFERNEQLGGMIHHSRFASFKWPMHNLLKYYERKCNENPLIDIYLNTEVKSKWLEEQNYDVVLAATGAKPVKPPIPGAEQLLPATWAFGNEDKLGNEVIIIGGGEIGVETALHLVLKGKQVTVLEMTDVLAREAHREHYYYMFMDYLKEHCDMRNFVLGARCSLVEADGDSYKVTYQDRNGNDNTIKADTVLVATGMEADITEASRYMNCGKQFYCIGDCGQLGNLQTAIRSAQSIANTI